MHSIFDDCNHPQPTLETSCALLNGRCKDNSGDGGECRPHDGSPSSQLLGVEKCTDQGKWARDPARPICMDMGELVKKLPKVAPALVPGPPGEGGGALQARGARLRNTKCAPLFSYSNSHWTKAAAADIHCACRALGTPLPRRRALRRWRACSSARGRARWPIRSPGCACCAWCSAAPPRRRRQYSPPSRTCARGPSKER